MCQKAVLPLQISVINVDMNVFLPMMTLLENVTKNETYKVHAPISQEDIDILMAGGALNYIRNQQ